MISCSKGNVKIEGSRTQIKAELTCLINSLIAENDQVLTEHDIMRCLELAKMDDDELDSAIESMAQQMTPEQLLSAMISAMHDFG